MSTYGVIDLTSESPVEATLTEGAVDAEAFRGVSLDHLRSQLEEIRDALLPVASTEDPSAGFRLQTLEVDLTLGAEGRVWFIAKGSAEASIKLTFAHPAV